MSLLLCPSQVFRNLKCFNLLWHIQRYLIMYLKLSTYFQNFYIHVACIKLPCNGVWLPYITQSSGQSSATGWPLLTSITCEAQMLYVQHAACVDSSLELSISAKTIHTASSFTVQNMFPAPLLHLSKIPVRFAALAFDIYILYYRSSCTLYFPLQEK